MSKFNSLLVLAGLKKPPVPTPLETAVAEYVQAQRDLLDRQARSEEYAASVKMLEQRLVRLSKDIKAMQRQEPSNIVGLLQPGAGVSGA